MESMFIDAEIEMVYTNWKGETGVRRIKPLNIWFGSTEFHPEEQLLLTAIDLDKNAERTFAVCDIRSWKQRD